VIGKNVGAYQVLSKLGEGGMGEVYRARDSKLGRDVALKILPAEFALDAERVARFKREAQVLASLNHPGIAAIYGFEDSGGVHALVLELVEGATLADRIAQGALPLDEALPIARQIAEALEAAHEQGIIHRDLKPANIKVRPDGTVKVLDFGLAKLAETGSVAASGAGFALSQSPTITTPAMTMAGMILGTAAYMSPEQAKGRPADKRSDIWAFGCVLFEMLTGRRAFEGDDVSDTLASVLKSEPDWSGWPGSIPVAIRLLIERCLAKDRRLRVGDMSTARFVLGEAATLGARPTAVADTSNRATSQRVSRIFIAGAVMATALIAAGAGWYLRPAPASPKVVSLWMKLSEEEKTLPAVGRQILAISPDGMRVALVANQRIWLRSLSEFNDAPTAAGGPPAALNAAGVPGGIHSPAFSPDGESVAFYSSPTMKRVAFSGGAPVTLCTVAAPFGVTWDVSGLYIGEGASGVVRCSPDGSSSEQIVKVHQGEYAHGPQMLPDGRHLLFTIATTPAGTRSATRWDQARIVVQDLKSGEQKTVVPSGADGRYVATGHLLYAVGGVMFAVPFDLRTLETRGSPAPVIEGVARSRAATTGIAHAVTSNNGSLVYMRGPVSPNSNLLQLALSDRAGMVTPLKLPPGPFVHVRASRDGKRLALGSDDGREAIVWVYDIDGTTAVRRLTLSGKNRFPIWSPDGERVAFQSDREGDTAIFAQRTDGTGAVERLTKPEKGEMHIPGDWSRDGKFLAFTVVKEGSKSLSIVSLADKKAVPFGNVVSAEAIEPAFSPDGHWIAYSSSPENTGLSPSRGVFVQPFPATGAIYQAPKYQLDFQPVWSPDGYELIYVPSAASGRLAAVRFVTQPAVAFGTSAMLPAKVMAERTSNEQRLFDVLSDGRFVGVLPSGRFAGLNGSEGPGDPADPELRVVLNWFEQLKQRVPVK
jgi:eukaryotic-like serine/threonine-protein kinase